MDSIFSIKAKYRESYAKEYTRKHLIEILELTRDNTSTCEAEYKAAKKHCEELFPMTFSKNSSLGVEDSGLVDAEQRDDIVKFLNAEIESIRKEKQDGTPYPGGPERREKELKYYESLIEESREPEQEKTNWKDPKKSFEYLQFLYYMIVINRLCKQKGFSVCTDPKTFSEQYRIMVMEVQKSEQSKQDEQEKQSKQKKTNGFSLFSCLKKPSKRYLPIYNKIIGEIRRKISLQAHTIEDGLNDGPIKFHQSNKGRYDDSIHTLQQLADFISKTLIYAYGPSSNTLKTIERQERLFRTRIEFLTKSPTNIKSYYPSVQFESQWDELYFRLNYYRCMYWELDMLWAYQKVKEIALKPLPKEHELFAMREEKGREVIFENDRALIVDSNTGRLSENREISSADTFPSPNPDIKLFEKAFTPYIEDHIQEIACKTFRTQRASKSKEKRILKNIRKICEYFNMEFQHYGRNCVLTKSKLISAYQVFFMSQPKSKIAPTMKGTIKAKTPSGLQRSKNTVSSFYSNSSEKDSRYLQLICTWTNYQHLWNAQGSLFAQKFLEINILALKALTAVDCCCGMLDVQLHAEKVLFTAIETLIPDETGKGQLENCISKLSLLGYQVCADFYKQSLLTFGKFYYIFDDERIISLIEQKLKYLVEENRTLYFISLQQVIGSVFRVHSPSLVIRYNKIDNTFTFLGFEIVNWNIMSL